MWIRVQMFTVLISAYAASFASAIPEKVFDVEFNPITSYKLDLDYDVMGLSEAVTWIDDETIWIGSEGRSVFSVKVDQIPVYKK